MSARHTLGQAIKSYRLARGWKQEELSRRTGIRQSYISQLENDVLQRPGWEMLQRLATAFDIAVDDLISGVLVPLPSAIDQLRGEGLPERIVEELAVMWPDLLPEDRLAVVEHTRALWERRKREKRKADPGPEPVAQ